MKKMKTVFILVALAMYCGFVSGRVVINEVLYDPVGVDTGFEWLELYNSGEQNINLEGAQIQRGGASFSTVFTFPYYILRPGRYVLVGESQVPDAVFTTSLAFQNGGGATDGIRFVSADSSYTDTVLYDEPNINALIDDSGVAGTSFALDVPPGYSLARRADGWDTDNSAHDFIAEPNPTPGQPNRAYCDFSIQHAELAQTATGHQLSLWVANLSHIPANHFSRLDIECDGLLIESVDVFPLAALDSVYVSVSL
ncbi:MAG: lamin tail domain-containing protein, partial [Candidatus Cloacimonadaceae bacterium]|nr:lamin tail domain-containing protein [Candidatus Cloacimonadaceae bacterium]